jgi:hypothetical protein
VKEPQQDLPLAVRILDKVAVGIIKVLIGLAHLKSRDPREHAANLIRPDPTERVHIRDRTGMLEWPPQKRVGCLVGVTIGIAIGGAILWYGIK